jgi:uncharacterized membrane protein
VILRILPWAIWAALMIFSVGTFDGLPTQIPQHMNAAGAVVRSVERSWMTWMLLPIIAAATQGLLTGLTLLLPRNPELFSFPEKDRFLKLPREYQGDAIARMQETMDVIGALTMILLLAVQVILWRTALGHASKNALPFLMIGTIVFIPIALVLTARVNAATEVAEKKWRAATAGKDWRTSDPR